MSILCDPPRCCRYPGHDGECRPRIKDICGYWLPLAHEPCARSKGHSTKGAEKGHRSRYVMDSEARSRRRYGDLEAA